MFCTNCGQSLSHEDKFCSNCGKQAIPNDRKLVSHTDATEATKICSECNKKKRQIYVGLEPTNEYKCLEHEVTPGICPLCNAKLRTDKAQQCHKCLASWRNEKPTDINNQPVNYYSSSRPIKCPKCSSNQISTNRKGIGVKRAILGGAVLGPLGLLAGATGRKKIEISCLNCGHKWSN